jgi:hypothetical protein
MNFKSFSYLIIANIDELFLPETFLLTGKALDEAFHEGNYGANRAMFYEGDNKIVILPLPIEPILIETYRQQLGYQNVIYWYPMVYTGQSLCKSVLNDSNLFQKIVETIIQNPNIIVTSYAYSLDFEALIHCLKQFDLKFQLDNVPTDTSIVRKLNSKAHFRRVAEAIERETGIQWIPKGKIVAHLEAALTEIRSYIKAKTGFVVKANHGATGRGLFLSPPIPTENTIVSFLESVEQDPIWTSSELVVETQIIAKLVHSPSVELKISENNITITYLCNQILDEKGAFLGILLGKNVVSPTVETQMRHTATLIAKAYQSMGYRGFFDVDFVIDDAQKAFAVETNARRTGGTHIYDILRYLYGADWQEKIYAASNDSWELNQPFKNGAELLERFKSRLYNGEEGLIITNFSIELGVFGFVLIAKTAESLQTQLDKMGQFV